MKSTRPNPPQTGHRPVATRLSGQSWPLSIRRPYVQTLFHLKSAWHAETLATQRFQGNRGTAVPQGSTRKAPFAQGIFQAVEWLPVDERNTTETRQTRIPAEAKKSAARPVRTPATTRTGRATPAGHSPPMAMTRRHSGRDCVDNDMHTPRKHRRNFIEGTARCSSPCNRFRSTTRVENGAAACTTRRRIPSPKTLPAALGGRQAQAWSRTTQWSSFSTSSSYSFASRSSSSSARSLGRTRKIQPSPNASSLMVSGLSLSSSLTSTTSPETGE
jgi:hypothetical protein